MNLQIGNDFAVQYGELQLQAPRWLVDGELIAGEADPRFERAEIVQDGEYLRLVLRGPHTGWRPLSFGLRFGVQGAAQFLQMGYQSWDGSGYRELPAVDEQLEGFAVAQLVNEGHFLQLGFLRHDRFQHRLTLRRLADGLVLDVEVLWDRREALDGSDFVSEPLAISAGKQAEPLLREWAARVTQFLPTPPRQAAPITGWCSWYNLYAAITEENLLEHLHSVKKVTQAQQLPMHIFQIDDGFNPEMGDWLEVKPQFPRGIKPLLDDIRTAGFTPGLWIAPFLVGNRSRLYAQHPDWVVIDRQTDAPLVCMNFYGEFRWHKRSEEYYLLDTTHPEAMAYLRKVFRVWRHDWGCEYFKTDFMFYLAQYGPERVKHHREGQTRAEIWVEAARAIREEIGDAVWLGCGAPLWMTVGLVDALRIGRDVGANWDTGVKAAQHFENLAVRNFAHQTFWQADPDCVLLREQFHHLTPQEIASLARTSALMGGVMTTSDDLGALGPERLELWRFCLSLAGGSCDYPLLGTEAGQRVLAQVRQAEAGYYLHLLNPNPELVNLQVPLDQFCLDQTHDCHLLAGQAQKIQSHVLNIELPNHGDSLLFFDFPR